MVNKYIFMLLSILMFETVFAATVDPHIAQGGPLSSESDASLLMVWPATVYNPQYNWQYINITVKNDDSFKFILDFYNDLEWFRVEEYSAVTEPYTYCLEPDDCETRLTTYDKWHDVTDQYTKDKKDGKDKIEKKAFKDMAAGNQLKLRIKYKPVMPKGKWDMVLEDDDKNQDILDPWYDATNITQGFVYLTNQSFTDTYTDYDYEHIESFENLADFSVISGFTHPSIESSDHVEYTGAVKLDLYNKTSAYIGTGPNHYASIDVEGKTCAIWYYLNDTTAFNYIRVYLEDGASYYVGYIDYFENDTEVGWNKATWDCTEYWSGNPDPTSINDITVYYFANSTYSKNVTIMFDHLYAYDPDDYLDSNYDTMVNAELQYENNGYGYNSTMIHLFDNGDTSQIFLNNTLQSEYTNYEIIGKWKLKQDLGSEWCHLKLTSTNTRNDYRIDNGHFYARDSDGNAVTHSGVSLDTYYYFRAVVNNSFVSYYYSNMTTPTNWQLLINFTADMDTYPFEYIGFRALDSQCIIDNVIIRELLPLYNPIGDYHASFVYDSSNSSEWNRYNWLPYLNDVAQPSSNDYSPTDAEIPSYTTTMTSGEWYMRARVYDVYGEYALNYTQTVKVGLGNIQLHIKNESDIDSYLNDTLTVDIIVNAANYSNQSSVLDTINYTDVPIGEFEFRYYGTDYNLRNYFDELTLEETKVVTLYASKTSNYFDVYVLDFSLTGLRNATITVLKWDSGIGGGLTIAEGKTNAQGIKRFYLDTENTYYKFIISYQGTTIYSTDWEIITGTTYKIITDLQTVYNKWPHLSGTLTFDNTSKTFILEYTDKDTSISKVCLKTDLVEQYVEPTVYLHTCLTTTSGSIEHTINETKSYVTEAYYVTTQAQSVPFGNLAYTVLSGVQSYFRQVGIIIAVILTIALVLGTIYVSQSATAGIVALDMSILASWFMKIYPFNTYTLGIIIPGSFVVMYYLNKQA